MSTMPKICILSEYAYPVLKQNLSVVGGAEIQMVYLAKEFVKRNYDVSLVVFENLSAPYEEIDEIKVYSPFSIGGNGYSYALPWNIKKLLDLLSKINADIHIQRAGSPLTGLLAIFAHLKKKIFIYSASSDGNVSTHLEINRMKDIPRLLYKFGVMYSDCVVCQSIHQKKKLMDTIDKKGIVIKNIYIPTITEHQQHIKSEKKVIWVGRIAEIKRPELFIELAKRFPEFKFQMIGPPLTNNSEYYESILEEAAKVDNLEFLGYIPHNEIVKYYEESSLLVCTSISEGFPNTFMEAWGNGIPVASLGINPDGIISSYKLGLCSNDFDNLVKDTLILLDNDSLRMEMGNNGRQYIIANHSAEKIIDMYEKMFESLLSN